MSFQRRLMRGYFGENALIPVMYCTHWKMSPGDGVEIIGAIFRAHFRYLRCRAYRVESQPRLECSSSSRRRPHTRRQPGVREGGGELL